MAIMALHIIDFKIVSYLLIIIYNADISNMENISATQEITVGLYCILLLV